MRRQPGAGCACGPWEADRLLPAARALQVLGPVRSEAGRAPWARMGAGRRRGRGRGFSALALLGVQGRGVGSLFEYFKPIKYLLMSIYFYKNSVGWRLPEQQYGRIRFTRSYAVGLG